MKTNKMYYVQYLLNGYWDEVKGIAVLASSACEAYDKAVFGLIRIREGREPYSAWVHSVTYQNGNVHYFNTCDGKAY